MTTTVTDVRELYRGDYRRLAPTLPGAEIPWLSTWRAHALEQFMDTGFPTPRQEEWKYTDVRPIAMRRFAPLPAPGGIEREALPRIELGGVTLVFVDGRYSPSLSDARSPNESVRIMSIAQALHQATEDIELWLGRYTAFARHGFNALNAALMQDGAFIHIPQGVAVEAPIQLLFISTGTPDAGAYLRNIIVADSQSRATVIESYAGFGAAASLTNVVTEIVTEAGAVLEHYRLEREPQTSYHIGSTHVHQARDSRYLSHSVALGGRIARHELSCVLDGEGARCELSGLYVGSDRQHLDRALRVEHHRPRCVSRQWYKGVLDHQARGIFSGRVVVHPSAQQTDAQQMNRNLLLSDSAEADSRPQFEIYADDVKCSHGATTGALDPDVLFYLRTRGLDEARARQTMVYGFANEVLTRMPLAPVRKALESDIAARWFGNESESVRELIV